MIINISNEDQIRLLLESLTNQKNAIKDLICQSDDPKECDELFDDYDKICSLIIGIKFAKGDK